MPAARFLLAVALLAVLTLTAVPARAHPFHQTLTQFEHNTQNNTLELAIRIDALDLEQMIERWLGERIDLETDPRAQRSIELWLRERLAAQLPTGEHAKMLWIGDEFEGAFCWLYVQFKIPPGTPYVDLAHIVLFDWHPAPTNLIVGVGAQQGQSYATTLEEPVARIIMTTAEAGEHETKAWWWEVVALITTLYRAMEAMAREL